MANFLCGGAGVVRNRPNLLTLDMQRRNERAATLSNKFSGLQKSNSFEHIHCKGASFPSELALHLHVLNHGIFMQIFSDICSFHHVGIFFSCLIRDGLLSIGDVCSGNGT